MALEIAESATGMTDDSAFFPPGQMPVDGGEDERRSKGTQKGADKHLPGDRHMTGRAVVIEGPVERQEECEAQSGR